MNTPLNTWIQSTSNLVCFFGVRLWAALARFRPFGCQQWQKWWFPFPTTILFKAGHDDVIKWKHFPRYWPFVRGIHRSPVTRSFDVFFDLRLHKRLSKQSRDWWFETLSRPLWRHRNVCTHPSDDPTIHVISCCLYTNTTIVCANAIQENNINYKNWSRSKFLKHTSRWDHTHVNIQEIIKPWRI